MATFLQAQGSRSLIAYIEETDWGQTLSAASNWTGFRFVRESMGRDINSFESQELRSDRMISAVLRGNQRAEGDISFELGPDSHNLLLRNTIGGNWSTTGSGPYTHILVPATSDVAGGGYPQGMSFVKAFTDIPYYFLYAGCKVDSLSFDFPQEGIATCTARILGKTETLTASKPYETPLSYPAGDPYESNIAELYEATYNSAHTDIASMSWGSPIGIVTSARFSITNTLDGGSFVLGSQNRYSLPQGRRRIEGTFSVLFKDTTYYTKFVNGTHVGLQIKAIDSTGTYSHTFQFPNVIYRGSRATPVIDGEGGLKMDIPFRAIRHANIGYDVRLTAVTAETIALYA